MKSIKNESGSIDFVSVVIIVFVVAILAVLAYDSYIKQKHKDFQTYFSLDPISISASERSLVVPMVNKKLGELGKIVYDASDAVANIRNEPESVDPIVLKERLDRLRVAEKKLEYAQSDFYRACGSALHEEIVEECTLTTK